MSEHPSRFALEQLSVDDLPPSQRASVEAHVQTCADCRAILDALTGLGEAHAQRPPEHFMMRVAAQRSRERRSRVAVMGGISTALAAVAAVLLFIHPGDEVRYKGGGLNVFRRREAEVKRLGPDDRIAAGDALQLVLSRAKPGKVTAWAIDADGRVDPITDGAISVEAGDAPLPSSVVVEAPCRDLWLVVQDGESTPQAMHALAERLRAGQSPSPETLARHLRCP